MGMYKDMIENKIFASRRDPEFIKLLATWRSDGKSIIFTNGCFDLIHRGHVEYLSKAAESGDCLVIGLNTDTSVSRLKGPHRPLNDQAARAIVLAALFFVDAVVLFEEDTPFELIKSVMPSILVKGGDYKPEEIVGNDIVKANNGKVVVIDLVEGYSSSALIRKLNKK